MEFKKYPDIKNAFGMGSQKTIDKFIEQGKTLSSIGWCITEKCHGAHFDIAYDGIGVKFWTRKRMLSNEEDFYGYHRIKDVLIEYIKKTYDIIKVFYDLESFDLIVCGELFGGNYPHKNIEVIKGVKRIQKRVYYHPDIKFYPYDVKINGEFINYLVAIEFMKGNGFYVAIPLKIGTFDECMEYPNDFQTTIPAYYNLPEIEGNICEGWVLKPIEPVYLYDGKRVILKSKNSKFDERDKLKRVKKIPEMSEQTLKVWEKLSIYITQQRLDSVLSKINKDDLTRKNAFGKMMGMFRKDIMDDFNYDYKGLMNSLDKQEKQLLNKEMGRKCTPLVRKEYLENME